MKRYIVQAMTACVLGLVAAGAANAEGYPSRAIRMIVPFPPAGSTDIMARVLAQKLSERLGQTVYVDNRGGAGGRVGTEFVARAHPDGYTLLMDTGITHTSPPSLYKKMPYNVLTDFTPITLFATEPLLVVVNPSLPVNSMSELIAYAKKNPGQLNYSSSGYGTSGHLAAELLKSMTGIDILHVPYQGGGPAVTAVISGQVQMLILSPVATLSYVKQGTLKALAITSLTRSPELPDIPTVAESGVPGYEVPLWFGLYAPAKTPRDIIDRLNHEVIEIMKTPEMRERLAGESGWAVGNTPEEFQAIIEADVAKWAKTVKDAGIAVQ